MIRVTYDPRHHRLRMCGHAGSAPKGEDLVCAAASALCCTLASNLLRCDPKAQVLLRPGYARIQARTQETGCLFEAFYLGLEQLSEQYPTYIRCQRSNCKEVHP